MVVIEASCRLVFTVGFRFGHLSLEFESLMHPLPVVVILERIQFSFEVACVPKGL